MGFVMLHLRRAFRGADPGTLGQGFKCKLFTWEVIPGTTGGEGGSETGKGCVI